MHEPQPSTTETELARQPPAATFQESRSHE